MYLLYSLKYIKLFILILLKRNIKNIIIGVNFCRFFCGVVLSVFIVIYSILVCVCWFKFIVFLISGI